MIQYVMISRCTSRLYKTLQVSDERLWLSEGAFNGEPASELLGHVTRGVRFDALNMGYVHPADEAAALTLFSHPALSQLKALKFEYRYDMHLQRLTNVHTCDSLTTLHVVLDPADIDDLCSVYACTCVGEY